MATVIVCNQCGRTLKPPQRIVCELRIKGFRAADVMEEIDCCDACAAELRASFVAAPGLDRIREAVAVTEDEWQHARELEEGP